MEICSYEHYTWILNLRYTDKIFCACAALVACRQEFHLEYPFLVTLKFTVERYTNTTGTLCYLITVVSHFLYDSDMSYSHAQTSAVILRHLSVSYQFVWLFYK